MVLVTAVCTAVMVITAGVVDVSKKSSVRVGVVGHGSGVAARFLDGVLADDLFPWRTKNGSCTKCAMDTLLRPLANVH